MKNTTSLSPCDLALLQRSVVNLYHAGEAIPVLTELISFIRSYSQGKEGERPTEKWFDELFTENTNYALKKVLNLLGAVVESESWEIKKKLNLAEPS